MHDGIWEHSQGYPHVSVQFNVPVEVDFFDLDAHESAFLGWDCATEQTRYVKVL